MLNIEKEAMRGIFRVSLAADQAIEKSYPVGYEHNGGLPKHAGVKGQFVYAALLNISNGEVRKPYIATIKLDEPALETETRAYFKNITIEEADALFASDTRRTGTPFVGLRPSVDPPGGNRLRTSIAEVSPSIHGTQEKTTDSNRQTERPGRETVRHSTSPGSVRIAESVQRIPDAWVQTANFNRTVTIQEVINFVKRKFSDNPLFKETYFQKRPDDRGAATFTNDFDQSYRAVVTLFKNAADASTLPHECAHWLYKMMESLVQNGQANETMAEDFRKLNLWLDHQKYKNKNDYRERMEFFARGFEAYLREGRAPDLELTGVFRTMKRLLMNI